MQIYVSILSIRFRFFFIVSLLLNTNIAIKVFVNNSKQHSNEYQFNIINNYIFIFIKELLYNILNANKSLINVYTFGLLLCNAFAIPITSFEFGHLHCTRRRQGYLLKFQHKLQVCFCQHCRFVFVCLVPYFSNISIKFKISCIPNYNWNTN